MEALKEKLPRSYNQRCKVSHNQLQIYIHNYQLQPYNFFPFNPKLEVIAYIPIFYIKRYSRILIRFKRNSKS